MSPPHSGLTLQMFIILEAQYFSLLATNCKNHSKFYLPPVLTSAAIRSMSGISLKYENQQQQPI